MEILPPHCDRPPFPGETIIFETFGDCDNFQAIQCSREPLPITNTFLDIFLHFLQIVKNQKPEMMVKI